MGREGSIKDSDTTSHGKDAHLMKLRKKEGHGTNTCVGGKKAKKQKEQNFLTPRGSLQKGDPVQKTNEETDSSLGYPNTAPTKDCFPFKERRGRRRNTQNLTWGGGKWKWSTS